MWEANGNKVFDSVLTTLTGWTVYVYPLGIDLTPNGLGLVYGYSNSRFLGQYQLEQGTYFKGLSGPSILDPVSLPGMRWPTMANGPSRRQHGRSGGGCSARASAALGPHVDPCSTRSRFALQPATWPPTGASSA